MSNVTNPARGEPRPANPKARVAPTSPYVSPNSGRRWRQARAHDRTWLPLPGTATVSAPRAADRPARMAANRQRRSPRPTTSPSRTTSTQRAPSRLRDHRLRAKTPRRCLASKQPHRMVGPAPLPLPHEDAKTGPQSRHGGSPCRAQQGSRRRDRDAPDECRAGVGPRGARDYTAVRNRSAVGSQFHFRCGSRQGGFRVVREQPGALEIVRRLGCA
jgi:hypothetical protein